MDFGSMQEVEAGRKATKSTRQPMSARVVNNNSSFMAELYNTIANSAWIKNRENQERLRADAIAAIGMDERMAMRAFGAVAWSCGRASFNVEPEEFQAAKLSAVIAEMLRLDEEEKAKKRRTRLSCCSCWTLGPTTPRSRRASSSRGASTSKVWGWVLRRPSLLALARWFERINGCIWLQNPKSRGVRVCCAPAGEPYLLCIQPTYSARGGRNNAANSERRECFRDVSSVTPLFAKAHCTAG